jgi:hypothetical protein
VIDLQARLDALPEWPQARWQTEGYHLAVLARLALAREWIAREGHAVNCDHYRKGRKEAVGPRWIDGPCTCGQDALLKAMEVPT